MRNKVVPMVPIVVSVEEILLFMAEVRVVLSSAVVTSVAVATVSVAPVVRALTIAAGVGAWTRVPAEREARGGAVARPVVAARWRPRAGPGAAGGVVWW